MDSAWSKSNVEELLGIAWGVFAVLLDARSMAVVSGVAWAMSGISFTAAIYFAWRGRIKANG